MRTSSAVGMALALSGAATLGMISCSEGPSDAPTDRGSQVVHETAQALSVSSTTPCAVTLTAVSPTGTNAGPANRVTALYPSQFAVPDAIPFHKGTEFLWGPSGFGKPPSTAYLTFEGPLSKVTCTYTSTVKEQPLKLVSCTDNVTTGSVQTAQTFTLGYDANEGTWHGTVASLTLDLNVPPNSSTTVCLDSCSQGTDSCQAGAAAVCASSSHTTCATKPAPSGLHVVKVANGDGYIAGPAPANVPLKLRGANFTGPELACYGDGALPKAGGTAEGIFDGPATLTESIKEMKEWRINAVRVPLNQDCWLGSDKPGINARKGPVYQSAIKDAVMQFEAAGMTVILDLHRSGPPGIPATDQAPMPDIDSTKFWGQVAKAYQADTSLIFDLFNEPVVISPTWDNNNAIAPLPAKSDWDCWRAGKIQVSSASPKKDYCVGAKGLSFKYVKDKPAVTYDVNGMAALLKAVRDVDPNRVVLLGGLYYATYFDQWADAVAEMVSTDKLPASYINNVAASWHQYDNKHNTNCPDQNNKLNGVSYKTTCHATALETVQTAFIDRVRSRGFPVVIGEVGMHPYNLGSSLVPFKPDGGAPPQEDSAKIAEVKDWFNTLLSYADDHKIGYLAWSWSTNRGPWLLSEKTTTPSTYAPGFGFGQAYHEHLVNQPVCCAPL